MIDLVLVLLGILVVVGSPLVAHWGRKNQVAEIALIVILLISSFLVVLLGVLVRSSNVLFALGLPPRLLTGCSVVLVLAGLAGLALCVPPLRKLSSRLRATTGYDAANPGFESSVAAIRFSDGWWSDPPVFLALWMFVVVLAYSVVNLLAFILTPEAADLALTEAGRISPVTVVLGELPFAVVALCGVGIGVRRNFRETLARLGYGPIALPQVGIAALFVVAALLLSFAADTLFATLQPDLYERVGEVSEGLFSPEGLSPVSAILFALLIGVGAALGEETLFRGAVQPVLGITLTSILFASMHVQYGPSLLLGYIFVISVGLGLLRKRFNTTTSFLAHAGYNASGVLLTYFFGV